MINFDKLKKALQEGVVEISFTSLKSGNNYNILCTLQENLTPVRIKPVII